MLFPTRCGSALLSSLTSFLKLAFSAPLGSSITVLITLSAGFKQVLVVFVCPSRPSRLCFSSCVRSPASLLCECVSLAPRAPNSHHLCNVRPWFRQFLGCLVEPLARPRADPRVLLCTLCHVLLLSTHLHVLRVVGWTDEHHCLSPPRAACVEGASPELGCSGSSRSRRHPSPVHSRR